MVYTITTIMMFPGIDFSPRHVQWERRIFRISGCRRSGDGIEISKSHGWPTDDREFTSETCDIPKNCNSFQPVAVGHIPISSIFMFISFSPYSVWYSRSIQPKWMAQECYRSAKTGSCVSHDFVWTGQGRNLRSLKIARWLGMVSENDLKMLIFLIKWYEMIWDVQKTTRKNH